MSEKVMSIFEAPKNTRVKLPTGTQLHFEKMEGAYAKCRDDNNEMILIGALTEVTLVLQ
jgi:hypothetical protein